MNRCPLIHFMLLALSFSLSRVKVEEPVNFLMLRSLFLSLSCLALRSGAAPQKFCKMERGRCRMEGGRKKKLNESNMIKGTKERRREACWVNPVKWTHFQLACSLTPQLYDLFNYFLQGDILPVTIHSVNSHEAVEDTCTALHCSLQQSTIWWCPGG